MSRTRRTIATLLIGMAFVGAAPAAHAAAPDWVRPALRYLSDNGYIERESFQANEPMRRKAFARLMKATFRGGYTRTRGKLRAREVSKALVRVLGKAQVARHLATARSADGWDPGLKRRFGFEVVAREMGLRHDRPTTEEGFEASAGDRITQADAIWAVWKAKVAPSLWGADALSRFQLDSYGDKRRKVVAFALSLVGSPYVWGGEWKTATASGYPYGAQAAGGFDCSGFIWYALRASASGWDPPGRPYSGWALAERSSSDMARATAEKLGYKKLLPGDLVFFAPQGREAKARDVYHAGLYLGEGWMVHSSGSRAGISLAEIGPGSWWNDQLAWGRRVISK